MRSISERLKRETGTIFKQARHRIALLKPSPYFLSMSSLGFQQVYKIFNACEDFCAERCFLPDAGDKQGKILLYESGQQAQSADIIAVSIAYELEIPDLIRCFKLMGLSPFREQRQANAPLILMGGPLSFSNMETLAPFADVMILGEGEGLLEAFCALYREHPKKADFMEAAQALPALWLPALQAKAPACHVAKLEALPAYSQIVTPETEFSEMFLIEAERGCHRRCRFCVMRKGEGAGMRLVKADSIYECIPKHISKVGLVGAAVSDHPELLSLVERLVADKHRVSLSSLRTDRVQERLVDLLAESGLKTLTIAADGASERLRKILLKDVNEAQLCQAATLARQRRFSVKVYLMIGVPEEEDGDIDEFSEFLLREYKGLRVSLGVSPFVSKRHTPLDGLDFAGIQVVEKRLQRLQKKLAGRIEIRSVSAKWAFVEHALAQGGAEMAAISIAAVEAGGRFGDWKKALLAAGKRVY